MLPARPIKYYTLDSTSFGPSTKLAPTEAPPLDAIRPHMTCTEFVDSVWGFVVSANSFVFGPD
jgi:hypothetical protein